MMKISDPYSAQEENSTLTVHFHNVEKHTLKGRTSGRSYQMCERQIKLSYLIFLVLNLNVIPRLFLCLKTFSVFTLKQRKLFHEEQNKEGGNKIKNYRI